jgi:hypothetical protein
MEVIMESLEDPEVRERLKQEALTAEQEDEMERRRRELLSSSKSLLQEATKSDGRPGKHSRRALPRGFA